MRDKSGQSGFFLRCEGTLFLSVSVSCERNPKDSLYLDYFSGYIQELRLLNENWTDLKILQPTINKLPHGESFW